MNHLHAAHCVCEHATDAEDATMLLTMLGLYENGEIVEPVADMFELANPKHLPIGTSLPHKAGK